MLYYYQGEKNAPLLHKMRTMLYYYQGENNVLLLPKMRTMYLDYLRGEQCSIITEDENNVPLLPMRIMFHYYLR